jgi:hypothetical protein
MKIFIVSMVAIGAVFILMSLKKRSNLDTPFLSNNTIFVMGFFLVLMGIVFGVATFLKGAL